ncbi:cysteinyl leukotriene receptor 1-like [Rhincodon typus]|uniref:cysteinyl leukotriene receptor 1-like n=1 Tax=Rhincodon typus TaxID=259920 RepID=UPI00202E454D|nr:cysteinyl leukotriene receptor 1-like [Rhincodon typus]
MTTNAFLHETATIINTSSNRTICPEDHKYKYMVYSSVYSVVFVIGLLSNMLALFVFYRIAKSKNSSTVYLMNLAVADLLFVFSLPLRIVYYLRNGDWPFRDFLCRVSTYTFYVSMYCSIFFLTCLSISRFLSTVHHIRHQRIFTFRRCIIACIIIWLFVGVATAPFLLSGSQPYHDKIKCFEPMFSVSWTRIAKMNYFALTVGFLIPFAIILICYSLMIKYLMGVSWQSRRIKRDIAMIVLVLGVFLICFLPYHVQRTVHLHHLVHHHNDCELENILRRSVVATLCLAVANSCFDPLLYIFVGQGFRTFVRAWLKRKESNVSYSSSSSKLFVSAAFIQQGRMLESFTEPIKPTQTLQHGQDELLTGKSQGDATEI